MLFLRGSFLVVVISSAAMAASHQPVCPGPAAHGTARCHARVVVDNRGLPKAAAVPSGAYGPAQFRGAYRLPSTAAGSGQIIGIVDAYDDPNIESDLGVYSRQFSLPACTTANGCFKKVNQSGGSLYPAKNAGWSLEISLDVEIAHAICPNCKILLVEAANNSFANLLAAEDYAKVHATVVSNSWGGGEFSGENTYDTHFSTANKPITFSSGDNGYGVEYPAASQYVTAVGGTSLNVNSDNSYKSEAVWSGAGSGCSALEPKPTWQKDSGCLRRSVADISADADPNTGAAVYDTVRYGGSAGWFQVGGTSLASPLIAASYALAGNAAGIGDAQYIYGHASYGTSGTLHDVTTGSNGSCGGSYLCSGKTGYDGPTGLGTPQGTGGF